VIDWLRGVFALVCLLLALFSGTVQASILSDGFTQCAVDGGTCTPPAGPRYWVRYGSGDSFVTYTSTMLTIPCRDTIETGQASGFGGPYRTATPRICAYLTATGTVAPPGGLGFVRNGTNTTLYWPVCADNNYCTAISGAEVSEAGHVQVELMQDASGLTVQQVGNLLAVAAVLFLCFHGYATGSRR